jgi:hypothetical protein
MVYAIGDTITYQTLDIESYSRGYGAHFESITSKIKSIGYKLLNGVTVVQQDIVERKGNEICYKVFDIESYSRGYGVSYDYGNSTIVEEVYCLENNVTITKDQIISLNK